MIQPFSVHIAESALADMRKRLMNTRWTDEVTNTGWSNGTSLAYMKELANYWIHAFDWRKTEREINSYPNYMADIDGCKIHFIHVKGKGQKRIPLIMTHGWPGSFLEMMKVIPLLTQHQPLSFDLVIPSLMGYGFSQKITETGCNSIFVADLWHKLMLKLGYEQYGAQGGDVGAGVSMIMASRYPDHMIGLHLNFISGAFKPYLQTGEALSPEVIAFQQYLAEWIDKDGAYSHQHRTKPLTLAYGLNDSPTGLCAWIIEKFQRWSDNNGQIESVFTKDELLSNVSLYWLTESIHSSIRIYNESSKAPFVFGKNDFIKVPTALAKFPKELPIPPRSYIEKAFNIQRWTEMPVGGHFAAMEQPMLLAGDVIDFFKEITEIQ